DPALVERDDAVRIAEDDVHVVLDLDDGAQADALGRSHEDLHDGVLVRRADAAGRLVEQDDLGAQREGRGDVEELLVALGQRAGVPLSPMSLPLSRTLPPLGWSTPVSTLISVDLPAPFGPMIETNSPSRMERFTLSSAT